MSRIDVKLAEWESDIIGHRKPAKGGGQDAQAAPNQIMSMATALASSSKRAAAAAIVRQHIKDIVRKAPEAMVKVTGASPDMKRIGLHIDYIARAGRYKNKGDDELELENETGAVVRGDEAREFLKDEWRLGGAQIPEHWQPPDDAQLEGKKPVQPRHALKIIFSMPPEADRKLVTAAAKATVRKLFKNHQYVMAHHDDTDNQHTHVIVKMVDNNGKRMNPRKADLARWRAVFAQELNARGVVATATKRAHRLKRKKGLSQSVLEMRKRGVTPERDKTAVTQPEAAKRAGATQDKIAKMYTSIAHTLAESNEPSDKRLAQDLKSYMAERGYTVTLPQAAVGGPKL